MNPFTVLGLPTSLEVTDAQVRAAWRAIAAATHPDRPDGGNAGPVHRRHHRLRPAPHRMGHGRRPTPTWPPTSRLSPPRPRRRSHRVPAWPARPRLVPARIRHGRPWHLLARALAAALMSLLVVGLLPGQPSGPAVVTGLVIWFIFTGRGDLAPPPGR